MSASVIGLGPGKNISRTCSTWTTSVACHMAMILWISGKKVELKTCLFLSTSSRPFRKSGMQFKHFYNPFEYFFPSHICLFGWCEEGCLPIVEKIVNQSITWNSQGICWYWFIGQKRGNQLIVLCSNDSTNVWSLLCLRHWPCSVQEFCMGKSGSSAN